MSILKKQIELFSKYRDQKLMEQLLSRKIETGIIHQMTDEEYRAFPAINQSSFKYASTMNSYFYNVIQGHGVMKPTKVMEFGSLAHMSLLEPHRIYDKYVNDQEIVEDVLSARPELVNVRASKEYKAKRDELLAQGKTLLDDATFVGVRGCVEAVYGHNRAKNLLTGGTAEAVLIVQDPDTGLLLKGKLDYILMDGFIIDAKATGDASYEFFCKQLENRAYYVQAAFYRKLARLSFGNHFKEVIYVNVEQEAPHDVQCFNVGEATMEIGEAVIAKELQKIATAIDSGVFASYPATITEANIGHFAMNKIIEKYGIEVPA